MGFKVALFDYFLTTFHFTFTSFFCQKDKSRQKVASKSGQKVATLNTTNETVVDTVSVGLQALSKGSNNPLMEYNKAFLHLQHCRRLVPIIGPPLFPTSQNPSQVQAGASLTMVPQENVHEIDMPQTEDGENEEDTEEEADELVHVLKEDEPTLAQETATDVSLNMDNEILHDSNGDWSQEMDIQAKDDEL